MLVVVISVLQRRGFFGLCNTLPAAALNRLFRVLLKLAAKEIRTELNVVVGTVKLIGNSSSVYLIMDCSRHKHTKYAKTPICISLLTTCFSSL